MGQVFLRRIGQGFCGTVWAAPTASENACAIKREDGGPGRSLYNDYEMHQRVAKALSSNQYKLCVPECYQYVRSHDSTWWNQRIQTFPPQYQVPCNVLVTERIPPFPQTARNIIIDMYCPEALRSSTKSSEPDQDCLIRPYLGRRRRLTRQSKFQAFSLRNYPLHLDQIEELSLDAVLYAKIIAQTLAELYWRVHVDANDVEFVLAPPRCGNGPQLEGNSANSATIDSHELGEHNIWILDFDCCRDMPLDEMGVKQAVRAFYRNDPFYPRPGCDNDNDQILWDEFKGQFLDASEAILDQGRQEARLPALWVDLVEQQSKS